MGEVQVLCVAPVEIFASKIVALLSRTAARDLYDINNILMFKIFSEQEQDIIRKCVVFYLAVSGGEVGDGLFDVERVCGLTEHKVLVELQPVLRKKEPFDLVAAQERVKGYLSGFLVLSEAERKFLDCFNDGEYCPELVFDGEMLERLSMHPMAIWRTRKK